MRKIDILGMRKICKMRIPGNRYLSENRKNQRKKSVGKSAEKISEKIEKLDRCESEKTLDLGENGICGHGFFVAGNESARIARIKLDRM